MDALGTFTQTKHVNLSAKTQGIVAATNTGNVAIYSINDFNQDKIIKQIGCHFGPVSQMAVSPDNQYLFTAGLDGSLFIYNIGEQLMSLKDPKVFKRVIQTDESAAANDKKSQKDGKVKIVDPELADIVLVKRNEMVEWQQRQKQLKYDLALTKKKVEMKLKECAKRFDKQYVEIEKQKDLDIKDL